MRDVPAPERPTTDQLATALEVVGLRFERDELALAASKVEGHRTAYERLRGAGVGGEAPAFRFDPRSVGPVERPMRTSAGAVPLPDVAGSNAPDDLDFASIPELAAPIRSRQVSCVQLSRRGTRCCGTSTCWSTRPTRT